ncbi:MAG: nuclear transport factor 2 family protein [Sphingosinicella sp.]|nr:nuclear transport factor 2 family protein [Sphingosinicella sp.]
MSHSGGLRATVGAAMLFTPTADAAANLDDRSIVASLDVEYQAAVKRNDSVIMERILHSDFILVRGDGSTVSREEIIGAARDRKVVYEQQDEIENSQTVRLWGPDTAVVTACLWIKGVNEGQEFDRKVWFSDTYVRTPQGWKYVFAQVSLPLPVQ